jgi:deoxyuridine 5'-triphosphate nucleotidohydrolase
LNTSELHINIDDKNIIEDFLPYYNNIGYLMVRSDIIRENKIKVVIQSREAINDICGIFRLLGVDIKSALFPKNLTDELKWCFLRGIFEGNGKLLDRKSSNIPKCYLEIRNKLMLEGIKSFISDTKIPYSSSDESIIFTGVNCLDFLDKLYENCRYNKFDHKYNIFLDWLNPIENLLQNTPKLPEIKVIKTNKNAVIPYKARLSDIGYDLVIITEHKQFNEITTLYDTGIKLEIPCGYYVEIMARSSLSKSGYMLANNTAIIDTNYRGNLYIALTKVLTTADDIILPFRCCQMIVKKHEHVQLVEQCEESKETTLRDGGAFGSTN